MATLHTWGGISDLPSIDAECVAVLAQLIHLDELENLSIVASFDPSALPNGDFPVLETDGETYAGLSSITRHLDCSEKSPTSSSIQADITAWSSFIQSHGQALLDLYLYVSSANYWDAISPAYAKILPFYSNYLIPPAKRAAAIARTKHLGIHSLDLDNIEDFAAGDNVAVAGQPTTGARFAQTTNPEELIRKQKSRKWLQNQQHSDTFKLFQLTKAFFGPLEQLLGDKPYLLSEDEPTSVDFVALGYLSLMRFTEVPQLWLRDALETRYPKLNAYLERTYHETFKNTHENWRSRVKIAADPTLGQAAMALGRHALEWALPSVKQSITEDPTADRTGSEKKSSAGTSSLLSSVLSPAVLLPIGAVAGLALGIAKYISMSRNDGKATIFRAHENDFMTPTSLNDLGESGAMLSALGNVFDQEVRAEHRKDSGGGTPIVEVDVDVVRDDGEFGRDVVYRK